MPWPNRPTLLYKAELIRGPDQGPWKTIEEVELATLGWVNWFNTDRIHSYLGDDSPDQYEAPTLPNKPTRTWLESNETSLRETQGESFLVSPLGQCGRVIQQLSDYLTSCFWIAPELGLDDYQGPSGINEEVVDRPDAGPDLSAEGDELADHLLARHLWGGGRDIRAAFPGSNLRRNCHV